MPSTPTSTAESVARTSWTLQDLADAMGALVDGAVAHVTIERVSTDTRTLGPGDLFVALSGPNFDGVRFATAAVEAGAAAVVVAQGSGARSAELGVPVLEVACTRRALGDLGRWARELRDLEVVGITGSCGKTSTKEMLHVLLRAAGLRAAASPASFNNDVGVPHTLLACPEDAQVLVAELGTNGRGEIAHLARLARPTGAIVTNVGSSHLEGLGDEDGVATEKGALPAALPEGGFCVLNADCPRTASMASISRARVHRFSLQDPTADLLATDLQFGAEGTTFTLSGAMVGEPGEERRVTLPLLGRHQVQNALAALTAGRALGAGIDALLEGLPLLAPVDGRGVRIEACGRLLLDESYNANPTSTRAALQALASVPEPGRRVAVLGRMHELGPRAGALHGEVGAAASEAGLGLLVTIDADQIAEGAVRAGFEGQLRRFSTLEEARSGLEALLEDGDVVLIKGSRAARLDELVRDLRGSAQEPALA